MLDRTPRRLALLATFLLAPVASMAADPADPLAILEAHCLKCHGGAKVKAGLDLGTRDALLKGGDSGPAVEPGDAKGSLLVQLMAHEQEPHMPRKGDRLPEASIAAVARWIDAGASYDRPLATAGRAVGEDDRNFWSFRPLARVAPPAVANPTWAETPVDRFILSALKANGLTPSPPADRRVLIRRLYFDLIGLPLTPEELADLLADPAPDWYERLVDRLLASPRHGERWGRHWLDVARYADSDGYENDEDRPTAYAFRDFVIKALNDDLPFDTFAKWQLAGDEYAPDDPRALAATGFVGGGPVVTSNTKLQAELDMYRYDELDDMIGTTGSAFLGLTVACARCHDHKFDPIPTRDYYRLLSAFAPTRRVNRPLMTREERDERERTLAEYRKRLAPAQARRAAWFAERKKDHKPGATDDEVRKSFTDDRRREWDALNREVEGIERARPPDPPMGLVQTDDGPEPAPSYLLKRGDPRNKGEEVALGFLSVLMADAAPDRWITRPPPGARTTFRRRSLAAWLTDVDRGAGRLVARVIVNRLWQHHFGEGHVRTPGDFGAQGERPTHPELLDWLAAELIRGGWRLKPLHRLMVTSAAYMQSTAFDPAKAAIDPENRLLWHRRPLRLEAEALRDAILAASGRLNPAMYGPAVKPPIPPDVVLSRHVKVTVPPAKEDGPAVWRRGVYLFAKRSMAVTTLEPFDLASTGASCSRRNRTTVPTQALVLLNDPFVRNQARLFAARCSAEAGEDAASRVRRAYAIALGRPPAEDESAAAQAFLGGRIVEDAMVDFCQVLLGLNEFSYID